MSAVPPPYHIPLIVWVPFFVCLFGIVLGICVIVWVYQIRKATRETAEETKRLVQTVNDLHRLLSGQNNNYIETFELVNKDEN